MCTPFARRRAKKLRDNLTSTTKTAASELIRMVRRFIAKILHLYPIAKAFSVIQQLYRGEWQRHVPKVMVADHCGWERLNLWSTPAL
jgi:hypothetical protein